MSGWSSMMLPKALLRGLYEKGFFTPMPIQNLVIPEAIKNKSNIIGTAQTVSDKYVQYKKLFGIFQNCFFILKGKRQNVSFWSANINSSI
jgi:hypothetical protein